MINIIRQRLREQKNSILIYLASLAGYALLMISMFPTMKKMDIDALINSYPEDFAKFFGDSGMASFGTIEGFLSMEYLSFFFILILLFYVGSATGTAIAGQLEKRTADFNLSQPISRTKMLLSELIVSLLNSALLVVLTTLSIWLFCRVFDVEISAKGLSAFAIIATLLIWSFNGIGIFLSSIMRSKIGVMLSTVGLGLASYVFLSLTRLVEKLKDFDNFSIFKLYNPEELLKTGEVIESHIAILLIILIAGTMAAVLIFNKKDV